MSVFIIVFYNSRGYFSQEDKRKFGLIVQHQQGREWFAKFIDSQVGHCYDEQTNNIIHNYVIHKGKIITFLN